MGSSPSSLYSMVHALRIRSPSSSPLGWYCSYELLTSTPRSNTSKLTLLSIDGGRMPGPAFPDIILDVYTSWILCGPGLVCHATYLPHLTSNIRGSPVLFPGPDDALYFSSGDGGRREPIRRRFPGCGTAASNKSPRVWISIDRHLGILRHRQRLSWLPSNRKASYHRVCIQTESYSIE